MQIVPRSLETGFLQDDSRGNGHGAARESFSLPVQNHHGFPINSSKNLYILTTFECFLVQS
uniref:Uncharacterized protein n=1 Tax=Megaselia scalaris TaxID=36166 RepID=T1GSL7_MEGSC